MTTEITPAVAVQGLHKSFGTQHVLNGIDFEVHPQTAFVVLGRSGTGKSVLLKLLVGLQKPDAGAIQLHGRDITGLSPKELNDARTKVGFLFQDAALYDSLTLEQNVMFPLERRRPGRAEDHEQIAHNLLDAVGIDATHWKKLPGNISGGMKKRVGLARALALDPDILLCDEPTAGLDPITSSEIEELIVKLKNERGVAAIVVTHDLRGAKIIADRLALLKDGNIVIQGTYDELSHSTDPFVSEFMRDACM